jgi:site-specific recombinase XerD
MLFKDVYCDFLKHIELGLNLAPNTVRVYRCWLQVFDKWADDDNVEKSLELRFTVPVLRRFSYAQAKKGLRPRSIHNAFSPLRALGEFCVENGIIASNPATVIQMPKKDAPYRPLCSDQELELLLASTELQANSRLVARDRAMLCVLIYCGVRFRELLDIRLQDVSLDSKTVLIASGKGRKPRCLYPNSTCLSALAEWMRERAKIKTKYDWLWAYDPARRMGENGLRQMLDETKARAGLADHNNIVPHAIRRAYATRCLAKGMDLRSLSASLGHSNPQTTLIYTFASERPAEAMRDFADLRTDTPSATGTIEKERETPPSPPKPSRADTISRMRRRSAPGGGSH